MNDGQVYPDDASLQNCFSYFLKYLDEDGLLGHVNGAYTVTFISFHKKWIKRKDTKSKSLAKPKPALTEFPGVGYSTTIGQASAAAAFASSSMHLPDPTTLFRTRR